MLVKEFNLEDNTIRTLSFSELENFENMYFSNKENNYDDDDYNYLELF